MQASTFLRYTFSRSKIVAPAAGGKVGENLRVFLPTAATTVWLNRKYPKSDTAKMWLTSHVDRRDYCLCDWYL